MELEQLKDQWSKMNPNDLSSGLSLRNIISNRNSNPFNELQRGFRQRVILLVLVLVLLINQFSAESLFRNPFFWCYMVLWLSVVVFHLVNYRFVKSWENIDTNVREFLTAKVKVLRNRIAFIRGYTKIILVILFLLVEFLPYHGDGHMLEKWRALHPVGRLGIFAAVFVCQHFVSRWIAQRKFGRHLDRMEQLLSQTE